jgi:hypothetical protein
MRTEVILVSLAIILLAVTGITIGDDIRNCKILKIEAVTPSSLTTFVSFTIESNQLASPSRFFVNFGSENINVKQTMVDLLRDAFFHDMYVTIMTNAAISKMPNTDTEIIGVICETPSSSDVNIMKPVGGIRWPKIGTNHSA